MNKQSFSANNRSSEELAYMRESGRICAVALKQVLGHVKPGVTTRALNDIAEKAIIAEGGEISFQTVDNYPFAICTTVNDEVVHGLPREYALKAGDVLGIDIGALYKGWHSDLAESVLVGGEKAGKDSTRRFLAVGKKALWAAIDQAKAGRRVGDVSHAMQEIVEQQGYSVVRALTGHGVGKTLHEDPIIPCFGNAGKGEELTEGMTIAIEVIYNMGGNEVVWKNDDGWTIATEDGSLSGLFERTVAITKGKAEVLTPIE